MPSSPFSYLITCEQASPAVPESWHTVLGEYIAERADHEIWDRGTADIGTQLGKLLDAPVYCGESTRLLVDLNRSITNPALFSPPIRELSKQQRTRLLLNHYYPFRHNVLRALERLSAGRKPIFHLSVHSFTPVLRGEKRDADFGILFDPSREWERAIAEVWLHYLAVLAPDHASRANYPYRGVSDGHVTALRRAFGREQYIGIELEFNQALPLSENAEGLARLFVKTLHRALQNKRLERTVFQSADALDLS